MSGIAFWQFKIRPYLPGQRRARPITRQDTKTGEESNPLISAIVLLAALWLVGRFVSLLRR
jgi:hypothetical protein